MKILLLFLIIIHVYLWVLILNASSKKRNFIITGIMRISFLYDFILIIFPLFLYFIGIGDYSIQLRILFEIKFLLLGYLYHLIFLFSFLMFFKYFKFKECSYEKIQSNIPSIFVKFLQFISIITTFIYVTMALGFEFIGNPFFISVITIFWYSGFCFIVFLVYKSSSKKKILNLFLLFACILSLFIIAIKTGVRGRILWIPLLYIYIFLMTKQKILFSIKKLLIISLFIVLLIPSFYLFSFGEYRNDFANNIEFDELLSYLSNLMLDPKFLTEAFKNIFSIYVERSIGIINNYFLSIQYDFLDFKFIKIYKGLFMLFIPSEIYSDKPILGSPGMLHDMAMYKSMIYYNLDGLMGSVLASGHAFWELGYFGLTVYPLFYVSIIYCITSIKLPYFPYFNILIALIILGGLITDAFSTIFIPIYAILDIFFKSCLPLISLLFFIDFLLKPKKYSKKEYFK